MIKKRFVYLMTIMMAVTLGIGVTSCGGGDDSDGGGGSSITANSLVGWAFEMSDKYVGGENIETSYYYIEFKTPNFVMVHNWGNGIDVDGNYRWDHGEVDCMFTVSGNTVKIDYKNSDWSKEIVLVFNGDTPKGWTIAKRGSGTSEGSGSSTAGTSDMFGYYNCDVVYNASMRTINQIVSAGDYNVKNWQDFLQYNYGYGYKIIDGNTICRMYENVEVNTTGVAPRASKGWTPIVYKKESYYGRSGKSSVTIYVFFYYLDEPDETYKYVVNGSTLELSNGTKLQYKGNQLVYNESNTYTKR